MNMKRKGNKIKPWDKIHYRRHMLSVLINAIETSKEEYARKTRTEQQVEDEIYVNGQLIKLKCEIKTPPGYYHIAICREQMKLLEDAVQRAIQGEKDPFQVANIPGQQGRLRWEREEIAHFVYRCIHQGGMDRAEAIKEAEKYFRISSDSTNSTVEQAYDEMRMWVEGYYKIWYKIWERRRAALEKREAEQQSGRLNQDSV